MKKALCVLVGLLFVTAACFALESPPSNKVGYYKVTLSVSGTVTTNTQFGLPFIFWWVPTGGVPTYGVESRRPSRVIGSQLCCGTIGTGDRIYRQDGTYAYRQCNDVWAGTLETDTVKGGMTPGRAFWYMRRSSSTCSTLVLAGQVDTTANPTYPIPPCTVKIPVAPATITNTPVSWRDSREVPRNKLNLRQHGFRGGTITTSDQVQEQGGAGGYFWFRTSDNSWQGALTAVKPGESYWIKNRAQSGDATWVYRYLANGNELDAPPEGGDLPAAVKTPPVGKDSPLMQKINAPPATKQPTQSRAAPKTK